MKASEANYKAHQIDGIRKPFQDVLNCISKSVDVGHFKTSIYLGNNSTKAYLIKDKLIELGYKVEVSSEQISCNDSDYTLEISWED